MVNKPESPAPTVFRSKAKVCFERLRPPDFWKTANGFDTLVDYLEYIGHDDTGSVDKGSVDWVFKFLVDNMAGSLDGVWFDDFGWWVIATQRASTKSFFSVEQQDRLTAIASSYWKSFTSNAPHVWERSPDDLKDAYQPVEPGGVWNAYWTGTPQNPNWVGPRGGNPEGSGFEGIQNAVTNLLYLISARRMGEDCAADLEFGFLSAWFEPKDIQGKKTTKKTIPLLWREPPAEPANAADRVLIRERVTGFKDANGDLTDARTTYNPQGAPTLWDWFWVGDQGLLIGALIDRIRAKPAEKHEHLELIGKILAGVGQKFVLNNKLQSYHGKPPIGYEADYSTGKGVFWRYLLYAWENGGPDVQTKIKESKILVVLKESATDSVLKESATDSGSKSKDYIELINDVAALTAAAVMC